MELEVERPIKEAKAKSWGYYSDRALVCAHEPGALDIIGHTGLYKLSSCFQYISGGIISRPSTPPDIARIPDLICADNVCAISRTISSSVHGPMS